MNDKFIKLIEKFNDKKSLPRFIVIQNDKIVNRMFTKYCYLEKFEKLKFIWEMRNNFYNLKPHMFSAHDILKLTGYELNEKWMA